MTLPRFLAPVVLLIALLGASVPAAADTLEVARSQGPATRVVVAFLPQGGDENPAPVLDRLRRRPELAMGLMSMTQGRYTKSQAVLDMTTGTRTSAAAYDPENTPTLELIRGGDGTGFIFNWDKAIERADSALADIQPGLLGSAIPGGAAYVGLDSRPNTEAVVAADRAGDIARVSLGTTADQAERVGDALAAHRLVVTGLATGSKGDATLTRLIRDRRDGDLLLVIQSPPFSRALQLLPAGAAGLRGTGAITSSTTHLEGIVAGIDVPATTLAHLGLKEPKGVKGQAIRAEGPRNLDSLEQLEERLKVVSGRRNPTLFALIFSWLALVLVLGLIADRRGVRAGMRIGGLAVLWVLPLLLLAGEVAPGRAGEFSIVVGGGLALGALTDRLVRWPRAPVVPVVVTITAYAIDLAAGSPLIIRSLLGVNPRSGSRFYGLGNELEAVLAVLVLVGVAALLWDRQPSRKAAGTFAVAGALLGVIVGSGRLGADVGGVITVGAGTAVATILMLPGALTRRRILLAVLAPAAALVALAVIDLATGGDGHFTRTVLRAESGQDLWNVAERRYTLAWNVLSRGAMPFITALALLAGAYGIRYQDRIYAPLDGSPAWRAAMLGAFAGVVAGSLTNDSGPILLVFGTFVLASVTAYIRGDPALADEPTSVGARL